MTTNLARGNLVTALVTPCQEGVIDLEAVSRLVEFQIGKGTHGLFVLGTAGQGPLLTPDERKALLETIVTVAAQRISVICHVGATTTEIAIQLARHAEERGATAIASVPPTYYSPDRETVAEYYTSLIAAVDIPVYAYDNPIATGYSFTISELVDLAERGLGGVKVARSDFLFIQELISTGVPCWIANAHLSAAALLAGAKGSISTITNLAPRLFLDVQEAVLDSDLPRTRELQSRIDRFARKVRTPIIGGLHYGASKLGLSAGEPRRPLRMPNEGECAKIDQALADEGLV